MSDTNTKPKLTGFEGTFGELLNAKPVEHVLPAVGENLARIGGANGGANISVSGPGGGGLRSDAARQSLRTPVSVAATARGIFSPVVPSEPAAPAKGTPDIFLSPRVVDRQAFNDFSQSLRELIDQAAAGTEALRRSALEADQAKASLRETIAAQQVKLEQSTKLLAQVEQKAMQTRKLIEGAGDPTAKIEEIRTRLDTLVTERLDQLTLRVDEAVRAAEGRISSVDDRLGPLLKEADRRITSLNGQLDAQLAPSIAGLQYLCDRADIIMGKAGPDGATIGGVGLSDLVVRAERTKDEAAFALRQLDSVREQADQARRILGDSVNGSVPLIDEVASIQGHLEASIARATELGKTTQDAITQELTTQRDAVTQAIGQLSVDSERLRTELTGEIENAHLARRAASQAAVTGEEAAGHLTRLLDRLEPWHGVLLAPTGSDNLPLPLRDVLNAVRVELKRDLAGVASALRAVAERTEKVLEAETTAVDVVTPEDKAPAVAQVASTEPVPVSEIESKGDPTP